MYTSSSSLVPGFCSLVYIIHRSRRATKSSEGLETLTKCIKSGRCKVDHKQVETFFLPYESVIMNFITKKCNQLHMT